MAYIVSTCGVIGLKAIQKIFGLLFITIDDNNTIDDIKSVYKKIRNATRKTCGIFYRDQILDH